MIWVDVTNLPHVLFFKEFIEGHETLVTSRDFGGLSALLDSHGVEHVSVGRHGGKSPKDKLIESSRRVEKLAEIVSGVSGGKIEAALSKQSVELPRVAFGLGIPVMQFIDNEYAEKQNRLVLPLCKKIIVPKALDTGRLIAQGAAKEQILKVDCIFEASQIKSFTPDPGVPKMHGLKLEDYVIVRPEPYMASYFKGRKMSAELVERLKDRVRVVVLPRGDEEYGATALRNVDSLSLIYYAKAVLGGGGTMTREAALMGTPSISYYPLDLLGVDRSLIESGLLSHATEIDEIIGLLDVVIDRKQQLRERAEEIIKGMEDPFEKLKEEINNLADQSS